MATKNKKKKLILLDAHAILHRAYHALPDFTSSKGEPTGGLYGIAAMLLKIISDLKPDYLVACYDRQETTFRKQVYKEYKGTRAKTDDALVAQMDKSREIFEAFGIPIYDQAGFEADDIIGTIVEQIKGDKNIQTIIASGDMDTVQLVKGNDVVVYTMRKGLNDTVTYNEKAVIGRYGFVPKLLPDYKGLCGDPSDNIIGVRGIGAKTATDLILKFGTIEDIYKKLKKTPGEFELKGIKKRIVGLLEENEEEALFSKTLAIIRRDADIDFKLTPKVWAESFDLTLAETTFAKYEFRSLLGRLHSQFSNAGIIAASDVEEEKKEDVDSLELKEILIALWLLNSEMTNPTIDDIYQYSGVRNFKKAKVKILKDIKDNNLEKVYKEIELPIISIIEEAEKRGVLIDQKHFKNTSKDYHKKLSALERDIYKQAGLEFNINSPKQLAEILFDKMELSATGLKKTSGGARSTRESELLKLKDKHPIIEKILSYRELQKLLTTYIDNIPSQIAEDNRLHTNLNQTGTTTGRMSSNNPNLQNIPARDGLASAIRQGFITTPGFKWVSFDYSQIEMRILALLSGDEKLIKIFQEGKDIHSSVASFVFNVPEGEVTKDMRRKAKVINFGIVYGMGVNALRVNIGGTRAEAQEFYDNYFKTFPTIKNYFDSVKKSAETLGYTETYFGRRRYFAGIKSRLPFIKAMAERMAVNAPIQGTATADIIKIAMKRVDDLLEKKKMKDSVFLLLQVHDELIYEIKEDKIDLIVEEIKKEMESVLPSDIPLVVGVSSGYNWAELK